MDWYWNYLLSSQSKSQQCIDPDSGLCALQLFNATIRTRDVHYWWTIHGWSLSTTNRIARRLSSRKRLNIQAGMLQCFLLLHRDYASGAKLEKLAHNVLPKLQAAIEESDGKPFQCKQVLAVSVYNILATMCFGHE